MRIIALTLVLLCMAAMVQAADIPVKVYVNAKPQTYDPPALLRAGSVYVPLREGAKSLGVEVKWQAQLQSAQICTPQGCSFIHKRQGIIVDGRMLLPLRKMGEAVGAEVRWDGKKKSVFITK